MQKNESVDYFLRFLNERFDIFKHSLEALKETLVKNDANQKIEACNNTLSTLGTLKEAMSATDRPAWIGQLEMAIKQFIERHRNYADAGKNFVNAIIAYSPLIANQKWDFAESGEYKPIDFDAYFQRFYDESRLPELFDELVVHLQAIIVSGEVDSNRAITQLQKLINTIKRNANGSYFSVHATFEFAISLLKNLILEYIGGIPVLGETLRAVQKTISELEQEFEIVQQKTKDDVLDKLHTDLPILGYTPRGVILLEHTPSLNLDA